MLTKIRSKFQSEDNKRLLGNFISLSVLQGMNYILPLITFPYLVRVLGIDNFGLLAFATATIAYFNIITDYGFNLTATREISIHRDSREKIIEIFSSVMTIKLLLMLLSFCLLSILVFSFQKFSQHWEIYFLTFGSVIGQVLFPIWFFQGMERMKYITYLNIVSKSIFTVAVFVFVHNEADVWIVPLLTSIGFIVVGIWSLFIIRKQFNITFKLQSLNTIKYHLKDGWHVFQQQFYVSMYGTINIVFLGIITNSTIVGYYSIAEKILSIPMALISVATQAYYPYAVNLYKKCVNSYFEQLRKITLSFILFSIIVIICLLLFGSEIIRVIAGSGNDINHIDTILKILAFGFIFSCLGQFYTQIFVTLKQSKILNKISFSIMILNITISPIIIYYHSAIGLSFFVIFRQFLVIFICSIYLYLFQKIILKKEV